ncbi:hypothetical protein Tco_0657818 [Tanacetum coccineum]
MANVSKSISIPYEDFSDDTTPSVAQKFLNEVKSTIVTLQQAAKFVREFKSLAKEAGESMVKQKTLELEIEHLLREVVSQDIMSIMQNPTVVKTSDLPTDLEHPFVEIPSGESKVRIEVLSMLWGNRLPGLVGSLPLSRKSKFAGVITGRRCLKPFKKVEEIPEVEIRLLALSCRLGRPISR